MKGLKAVPAVAVLALVVTGCASEKLVAKKSPAPPWVKAVPADTEEELIFVGTGLGDNILDERNARARAMEHVRTQIANSLDQTVIREATEIVEEEGAAHRGADEDDATYSRMIEQRVKQAMSGVRLEDFYWEKWQVDPGLFSRSFSKYKYYVKASIPREQYARLRTEITHAIADRMAGE